MSKTVIITLELDENLSPNFADMTWGQLRELIAYRTPAADNLRIADGLSSPIAADTGYGRFSVEVAEIVCTW